MPKIAYESKGFRGETLGVIAQADEIVTSYQADGLTLTLRQLYYRFVAGDLFPDSWSDARAGGSKNTQRNYKRLGSIVGNARMAGLLDWRGIEDRTRGLRRRGHWETPAEIISACAQSFAVDRWRGQDYYLEVWFEKDALLGIFESPCNELDVPFFSCRGYGSLSELWAAGRRMREHALNHRVPAVIHFGDHDPSGIDMTRDVRERLSTFAECNVEVERVALNLEQVEEYAPPPNPAKMTDSRFAGYASEFGFDSWELDALDPRTLRVLVEDRVEAYLDRDLYENRLAEERRGRQTLALIAERWPEVVSEFGEDEE